MYDKWSKKPTESMSGRINSNSLKVEIKDANDGKVGTLSGVPDYSFGVSSYSFALSENFKGGFYKVETSYSSHLVDSTKFFVTSVRERRNAVTLNMNKDALTANDEVIGKVTLKMLTKGDEYFLKGAPGEKLNYTVKVMDQGFNEMEQLKKTLNEGSGMFSFHTPASLNGISDIIILVEIFVEGQKLEVTRQISVKSLKDMHVRFVPDGGKYSLGFENEVYFACFTGEKEKTSMSLNHGVVIERDPGGLGIEEQVVSGISSNEDGRGKFTMKIQKKKEYVLVAKEGNKSKKFLILGEKDFLSNSEEKMSMVSMKLNKKVFKWEDKLNIKIEKSKTVMEKKFRIVVLDKLRVCSEVLISMDNANTSTVQLDSSIMHRENGGVLTVQLYKAGQTAEAVQESLIYVEPKEKLGIHLSFDKERYAPKDEVGLNVEISGKAEGYIGIVVSDETPYLEIEKRNYPVSLCSKVFLEKELHFKSNEWVNSVKYLDAFFENNPKKEVNKNADNDLECLLGVQDWRLFFLTESNVKQFAKEPKKDLGNALRYLLGLSPEKIHSIVKPPSPKLFAQPMFFGKSIYFIKF
jgi:hypothetical protein